MCLRETFATQLLSQWSLELVKALSLRLNQSFGLFTMSFVERSSQSGVFRHLSKDVFRGRYFRKYISYEGHLFFENVRNLMQIRKTEKKIEKNSFFFWDKCIWNFCIHLSLLLREYLSLAVNLLRKGLKNFHVSNSEFSNSWTFTVITRAGESALIKIESVFWTVYHVACREVLSNRSF